MLIEFQRLAIFGHSSHYLLARPSWNIRLDLERDSYLRADEAGEMRDYLVGDLAGVAPYTLGIQGDGTVESLWPLQYHCRRVRGARVVVLRRR